MVAIHKRSSIKETISKTNTTNLINDTTKFVQSKVKDNIQQKADVTLLELSSKISSTLKSTFQNEEMANSFVYSEYETATISATKLDINTLPAQTVATLIINNKRPTIIVYPTVSPESVVIPIVSCIFGFPLLALLVICFLRRRAKLARERDRRRNYDLQDHAVSLVRFSPIHRLNNRSTRAISLRPERSLSRGFPSLELDTVLEERSDVEQTQTEMFNSDSPLESTSQQNSCSS